MIAQTIGKNWQIAVAISVLAIVSGCASQGPAGERVQRSERSAPSTPSPRPGLLGARAAAVALDQVGVPYRYGGASTSGFDCSGLVQYSYNQAGKNIPRTTRQLWSSTTVVGREDIQIGDLIFFKIAGKMSHVGMYIGNQRFVHSPSSGRHVSVASLTSPFYARAFLRAGRP